jgi:hypothetical protein
MRVPLSITAFVTVRFMRGRLNNFAHPSIPGLPTLSGNSTGRQVFFVVVVFSGIKDNNN